MQDLAFLSSQIDYLGHSIVNKIKIVKLYQYSYNKSLANLLQNFVKLHLRIFYLKY